MQSVVTSTATSIASNLTTVVGTPVAMLAARWQLALVTLVVLPPAVSLTRQVARMRYAVTAARQRKLADLHVAGRGGPVDQRHPAHQDPRRRAHAGPPLRADLGRPRRPRGALQLAGRWRMATMNVVFAAVPATLYLAAGLPATSGGMTIGTLVAFVALQGALFRPLMGLLGVQADVTASLALFSRIHPRVHHHVSIGIDHLEHLLAWMLGVAASPLTEKFLVRWLSANLSTLIRTGLRPGMIVATRRIPAKSADHAALAAREAAARAAQS